MKVVKYIVPCACKTIGLFYGRWQLCLQFENSSGKFGYGTEYKKGQVQIDNRGNFWIYNHTGKVWYVNAKTRFVKSFQLIPADKVNYIDEERYHIVHDSRDIVWISTYGNGLFAYDLATDELQHFESNINGFSHITSNFCNILWRIVPVVFGLVRNIRVFLVFRS